MRVNQLAPSAQDSASLQCGLSSPKRQGALGRDNGALRFNRPQIRN